MSILEASSERTIPAAPRISARLASQGYRGDIDGLRCLAVLLVVSFHFLPMGFIPGGYIGVDVFFVISGYLITGILVRELKRDTFSFASFYERRVRRILPALFFLLAVATLIGARILAPSDFITYAHSLVAAVLSYSNIYFWSQDSYFNVTRVKLLEHTWSLSVEEQFYLLFPAALSMLWKRRIPLLPAIAAFGVVSFAVSAYLTYRQPQTAFFMPYSRAWELMIGALLTATSFRPRIWPIARQVLAIAGLLMIALCVVSYSKYTPFPGVAALLPCCGTALLLWAGEDGSVLVSRWLAWAPFRFIGKISYSLYLWHWPLLLAAKAASIPGVTGRGIRSTPLLFCLTLLCAYLSWRFVEQPFRVGSLRLPQKRLFSSALVAATTLCGVAIAVAGLHGLPGRFNKRELALITYMDLPQQTQIGSCFISSGSTFAHFDAKICLAPVADKKNYLLLGDSHAAYLWFGLKSAFPEVNFMQATSSACSPVFGHWDDSDCGRLRHFVFDYYDRPQHLDGVVLASRWGTGPKDPGVKALEGTVKWFQQRNIPVTLIGPIQEYDLALPLLLAQAVERRDDGIPSRHQRPGFGGLDQNARITAAEWKVVYASLWQKQCGTGACKVFADDQQTMPLMVDTDHLSNPGSAFLCKSLRASGELAF